MKVCSKIKFQPRIDSSFFGRRGSCSLNPHAQIHFLNVDSTVKDIHNFVPAKTKQTLKIKKKNNHLLPVKADVYKGKKNANVSVKSLKKVIK